MVGRRFFDDLRPVILENHKVQDVVEEHPALEQAANGGLQFRHPFGRDALAIDGPPGHEPVPSRGDGAATRLNPVGDHQQFVAGKKRRNVLLVGLKLIEGVLDGGVFVTGVFQLENRQRQTVDEDHHIGTPVLVVLDNGVLVQRHPVVVVDLFQIQQPDLFEG